MRNLRKIIYHLSIYIYACMLVIYAYFCIQKKASCYLDIFYYLRAFKGQYFFHSKMSILVCGNIKKFSFYKLSSLWYFVTAAGKHLIHYTYCQGMSITPLKPCFFKHIHHPSLYHYFSHSEDSTSPIGDRVDQSHIPVQHILSFLDLNNC